MKRTGMFAALAAVLAFAACSKDPVNNLSSEESRIYITDYDSTANFSSYKTYSISDSVTIVNGNQSAKQLNETDAAYVAAVKKYMAQQGYTLVSNNANPDLGVDVSRVTNTSTGVVSYPDYYGGYGSYWDPYYWGYGGYDYYTPYVYGTYSVTESGVVVDLLDLKNAHANNNIKIVWTGLIRGEDIFNASLADAQVKALFAQSSYLKTNN